MPGRSQFTVCLWCALLLAAALPAVAQEKAPGERPASDTGTAPRFDQMLYKGVVGNLLDAVPMDASERTALQRTNAVASGAMSGKSLAALAGLAHPGFLIGGLVWGLWAASNIEPAPDTAPRAQHAPDTQRVASAAPNAAAPAPETANAGKADSLPVLSPVTIPPVASIVTGASPRPRVVRVWPTSASFN